MLTLYENIRKYRKLNKWSQEELAEKVGYTDRSMIAKLEHGKIDLPQSKIILFAKVFGITASELMGNDGCVVPPVTPYEFEYVSKIRMLDKHGRDLVMTIIDAELNRCHGENIRKDSEAG